MTNHATEDERMPSIDVRVMQAKIEAGITDITRRMDRQDEWLKQIHDEVRHTNGRVTRNEEQIRTLFRGPRDPKESGIQLSDLKWYLACVGGGAGVVIWILKIIGKL